jgi:hypothetical protein
MTGDSYQPTVTGSAKSHLLEIEGGTNNGYANAGWQVPLPVNGLSAADYSRF